MELDPNSAVVRKLEAMERHYGIDKLSDEMVFRIAYHKVPRGYVLTQRIAAVAIILRHKLPYPVVVCDPKEKKSE